MTLNEKVINYKILDLVILYNFDIKFDFIWDHMKKLWFFYVELFIRTGHAIPAPKNAFVGKGKAMTRRYKCHHFQGRFMVSPAPTNALFRGGWCHELPWKWRSILGAERAGQMLQ